MQREYKGKEEGEGSFVKEGRGKGKERGDRKKGRKEKKERRKELHGSGQRMRADSCWMQAHKRLRGAHLPLPSCCSSLRGGHAMSAPHNVARLEDNKCTNTNKEASGKHHSQAPDSPMAAFRPNTRKAEVKTAAKHSILATWQAYLAARKWRCRGRRL